MAEIVANFELNNDEISADMELSNDENIDADFVIYGGGTTWGNISGDLTNQTDLNNALSTLQTNIQSEATARANKDTSLDNDISTINGKINTINGTLDGLGNIVTHNVNEFATAGQGALADSSLQSGDNITELVNNAGYIIGIDSNDVVNALGYTPYNSSNPNGYTSNIGTVTSVNSVGPDSNGNVVISIPSAQIQSDWNQTNNTKLDYIKNKPSIPSQASDVNALPDSTKYGKSVDISLNTTDYKLTVSLKDQDGTVLNSKVVDFPLESVVVSGAYDDNTKKVILTLQNGSTVDFSVADLVAGLQAEITSSNKLDSDLVDDTNQTNKFVTATDISNWNGKQDSIADLSDIRDGAGAGATAVQPEDLSTVATTGSYTDLLNKPTIPSAQIQSDWNQADNTKLDYIKNKPTIPTVPSNVSAFTNDSGYITSSALNGYATETWVTNKGYITGIDSSDVVTALGYTPYNSSNPNGYTSNAGTVTSVNNNLPDSNGNVTISGVTIDQTYDGTSANAQSGVAIEGELTTNYQEKLSSGTNIKTVNNTTLLGSGNIDTSEIFLAVQGTTTFSQISTAYNSGKTILLKDENNDIGYLLRLISGAEAEFIVGSNTLVSVDDLNQWTFIDNYLNIPNAQVNSDWNAVSGVAQILNKPTIPTVNNATLTIQKNGVDVQTFTANASSNATANITVPTNTNELTNGAGFITGITSNDVTTALGYTPYDSSNPSGYTTNVGTVTSVNSVSPVNGNVSLSIPTVDQTFDGASANAESGVSILGLLQTIYPVGSVYLSTNSTCPMASLFGTWELVASDKALWTGDGTNGGTTKAAGLPSITGLITSKDGNSNLYSPFTKYGTVSSDSALRLTAATSKIKSPSLASSTYNDMAYISFDASKSSTIYGNTSTVQPPAYVVNVWRRTA